MIRQRIPQFQIIDDDQIDDMPEEIWTSTNQSEKLQFCVNKWLEDHFQHIEVIGIDLYPPSPRDQRYDSHACILYYDYRVSDE